MGIQHTLYRNKQHDIQYICADAGYIHQNHSSGSESNHKVLILGVSQSRRGELGSNDQGWNLHRATFFQDILCLVQRLFISMHLALGGPHISANNAAQVWALGPALCALPAESRAQNGPGRGQYGSPLPHQAALAADCHCSLCMLSHGPSIHIKKLTVMHSVSTFSPGPCTRLCCFCGESSPSAA